MEIKTEIKFETNNETKNEPDTIFKRKRIDEVMERTDYSKNIFFYKYYALRITNVDEELPNFKKYRSIISNELNGNFLLNPLYASINAINYIWYFHCNGPKDREQLKIQLNNLIDEAIDNKEMRDKNALTIVKVADKFKQLYNEKEIILNDMETLTDNNEYCDKNISTLVNAAGKFTKLNNEKEIMLNNIETFADKIKNLN